MLCAVLLPALFWLSVICNCILPELRRVPNCCWVIVVYFVILALAMVKVCVVPTISLRVKDCVEVLYCEIVPVMGRTPLLCLAIVDVGVVLFVLSPDVDVEVVVESPQATRIPMRPINKKLIPSSVGTFRNLICFSSSFF